MMQIRILLCCLGLMTLVTRSYSTKPVICYVESWWKWRPDPMAFNVAVLENSHCTHYIYSFVTLDANYLPGSPAGEVVLSGLLQYRTNNPGKKVMAAFGGASWVQKDRFAVMATDSTRRNTFVQKTIDLMITYDLDGVDMDWEFPETEAQKNGYTALLQELRTAIDAHSLSKGGREFLLTVATTAYEPYIKRSFDVPKVSACVDYINVMTYDLHGAWLKNAGHHSSFDNSTDQITVVHGINVWLTLGAAKEKLIVGIPTYGRYYQLTSPAVNGFDAPITGAGPAAQYTQEPGFMAYFEICPMVDGSPGNVVYPNTQGVPYYTKGYDWIGYESVASARMKAQYVIDEGFGGAMFWSLGNDDYNQICASSTERYPIINAVYNTFGGTPPPTTPPPPPPTTTTPPPPPTTTAPPPPTTPLPPPPATTVRPTVTTTTISTQPPIAKTTILTTTAAAATTDFSCDGKDNGQYPNPDKCTSFYQCSWGSHYLFDCPPGTMYDILKKYCDHSENVNCPHL